MSTAIENETIEAPVTDAEKALNLCGKGVWPGITMLLGVFATGTHVAMVNGLLPDDFTALLANGLPDSSLLYAGVVLLTAAAVMLLLAGRAARS